MRTNASSEELSMKKSSIKKHIESRKHKQGMSDIKKRESHNEDVKKASVIFDGTARLGESLLS